MKLSCILVPIKGLPLDEEVLQLAFTMAAPSGERRGKQRTRIEVIHVVEVPQAFALDTDLPDAVREGEAILAAVEKLAQQRDVEVEAEMLQARSAGVAIVDEAIERGADLIIMSTQYRRRHGEFSLGVTVPYVFKNAPCRLWVARGPRTGGETK